MAREALQLKLDSLAWDKERLEAENARLRDQHPDNADLVGLQSVGQDERQKSATCVRKKHWERCTLGVGFKHRECMSGQDDCWERGSCVGKHMSGKYERRKRGSHIGVNVPWRVSFSATIDHTPKS